MRYIVINWAQDAKGRRPQSNMVVQKGPLGGGGTPCVPQSECSSNKDLQIRSSKFSADTPTSLEYSLVTVLKSQAARSEIKTNSLQWIHAPLHSRTFSKWPLLFANMNRIHINLLLVQVHDYRDNTYLTLHGPRNRVFL